MKIELTLVLICATVHSLDDDNDESRKHFGLSTLNLCSEYVKTFKCMTACKSIGFQIFRLNRMCKCSCHEMKTSTILPFFKWRTNGTTRRVPRTYSPSLYHIVGSLSPLTTEPLDEETTEAPLTSPVAGKVETTTAGKEDGGMTTLAGNLTGGNQTANATE